MHPDDYKVGEFATCINVGREFGTNSKAVRSRTWSTSVPIYQRLNDNRVNYFNPPTNPGVRAHSLSDSDQIVFQHVLLRDQVWISGRCASPPLPPNTNATGLCPHRENNSRRPNSVHVRPLRTDRGITWRVKSRQIHRMPWNIYRRARYTRRFSVRSEYFAIIPTSSSCPPRRY